MKAILANPAPHGNGPYLRITELAIQIKNMLKEDIAIIVPNIYGEKQKRILKNVISEREFPNVYLDSYFGELLNELNYEGGDYLERLEKIVSSQKKLEDKLRAHISNGFIATSLSGKDKVFKMQDLLFEINHNPILHTGLESYSTTIGKFSEILKETKKLQKSGEFSKLYEEKLLEKCIGIAKNLESKQKVIYIPQPSTFSYKENKKKKNEIYTPPFLHVFDCGKKDVDLSVYVIVSGVKYTKDNSLFLKTIKYFKNLSYTIYCPPNSSLEGTSPALPETIAHENVVAVVARAGWSSVWSALFCEKPIITYYDEEDDPEIRLNIKTLEKLNLGIVIRNDKQLKNIEEQINEIKPKIKNYKERLIKKFGKLDGIEYIAEHIIKNFIKNV